MTDTSTPLLTIGLPVYNGDAYLDATIRNLLEQTFTDFRLVIADNASIDGTESICRRHAAADPRITYIRNAFNVGAAPNFNLVFDGVQSKYFKWAAHDDMHAPGFLQACIDVLESHPQYVLCFTNTNFIDDNGKDLGPYPYPLDLASASRAHRFRHFSASQHIVHEVFGVIRSDVLRKTGLIRSFVGSDLVMLAELSLHGPFYQVPETLFFHREHSSRSTAAAVNPVEFARWFDAKQKSGFVAPYWRRVGQNLLNLWRHPMPAREKLDCFIEFARGANWQRQQLLDEFRGYLGYCLGRVLPRRERG